MCILKEKLDVEEVTGYKVVRKIGNRYYSPYTGVQYKVGPVPILGKCRRNLKVISNGINCNFSREFKIFKTAGVFNKDYTGKTAIFKIKSSAVIEKRFHDKYEKSTIVKMSLKNNIFKGVYDNNPIYAGEYITKIEELTD